MKILHVLDHSLPYFSGYTFRSRAILENQVAHGFEVVALTSPKHEKISSMKETISGIPYYRCRNEHGVFLKPFLTRSFFKEAVLVRDLAKRIEEVAVEEKVDLIHSHSPSLNGAAAVLAARKIKLPVVYEARAFWEDAAVDHGTFAESSMKYKISRWIETRLFRKVDGVVTICEGLRREIVSRGIPEQKVSVIVNGVELDTFSPRSKSASLEKDLGLEGRFVVGFLGSFYYYEGLDILLKAFRKVIEHVPDSLLLLVGDGTTRTNMESLARRLGLGQEQVRFLGNVPHKEVPEYYSVMDLLVYPRKRIRLTELVTPLKPLEAMCMGKTVAGSRIGGIEELVQDGKTGVLFPPDDPESLAHTILYLIKDPDRRKRIGEEARRVVCESRNWGKITERYSAIYENAIRNHSA